jgi:hypothetical protein
LQDVCFDGIWVIVRPRTTIVSKCFTCDARSDGAEMGCFSTLTDAADEKWYEVPSAQSKHVEKMTECAETEKCDEGICCAFRWSVLVKYHMLSVAACRDVHGRRCSILVEV